MINDDSLKGTTVINPFNKRYTDVKYTTSVLEIYIPDNQIYHISD
jgi:hypothetical protein